MKKLFENFRIFVNEELTDEEKKERKKLKKRLAAIQHK